MLPDPPAAGFGRRGGRDRQIRTSTCLSYRLSDLPFCEQGQNTRQIGETTIITTQSAPCRCAVRRCPASRNRKGLRSKQKTRPDRPGFVMLASPRGLFGPKRASPLRGQRRCAPLFSLASRSVVEPKGFCCTLRKPKHKKTRPYQAGFCYVGVPKGIRTPVTAVKVRKPALP